MSSYPDILKNMDLDKLQEQFIYYQTMSEDDIPESIKASCCIGDTDEDKICQMDVLWGYLKGVKLQDLMN